MRLSRSARIVEQARFEIRVQIDDEFADGLQQEWLTNVVRSAIQGQDVADGSSIGMMVTGDETVRELNRDYRGIDETTDILSFSFHHEGEYHGEDDPGTEFRLDEGFPLPPDEAPDLGELVISYPQALRQAEEAGRPVEQEIAHLVAHGVLHLLGYDHADPDLDSQMRAKESEVLAILFPD